MDLFTIIACWFKPTAKVALVMSIIGLYISTILGFISTPIAFIDTLIYLVSLVGAFSTLDRE